MSRHGVLGNMVAEQDVVRLREVKARVEMLLSYYREMGDREVAFVQNLEARLRRLAAALGSSADSYRC